MSRLATGIGVGIAMEITRGEKNVAYVSVDGGTIVVRTMEKRAFDAMYYRDVPDGLQERSTPRHFARVYLADRDWARTEEAVHAMLHELALHDGEPRSNSTVLACDSDGMLVAAFERRSDALLACTYYEGMSVVADAGDIAAWPASKIKTLQKQVAPKLKLSGKLTRKNLEGIFNMAKNAAKATTKAAKAAPVVKAEKVAKERKARTDGPVAKVHQYVEANLGQFKSGKLTKAQARTALLATGLNSSTIGVQLPKALAKHGVEAEKGGVVRKNRETGEYSISTPKPKAAKTKETDKVDANEQTKPVAKKVTSGDVNAKVRAAGGKARGKK